VPARWVLANPRRILGKTAAVWCHDSALDHVLSALTSTHSGPATTSSVPRAPPTASRTMGSWNGVAQSLLRPVGVEPPILRSGCAWLGGDEAERAATSS